MITNYDYYIFDLYGTLFDVCTDEHADDTWIKWCSYLDGKGIKHPDFSVMRDTFFRMDREEREKAAKEGRFEYPEIDVIPIYQTMFNNYGNYDIIDEDYNDISFAFRKASTHWLRFYPGVENCLKTLREIGKKLYILSNAQASYTRPEILMFGLDSKVDDYIMSSDYGCMKPDKAFFDAIIDRNGIDRDKALMIGDSLSSDIKGAQMSSLHSYHLSDDNARHNFYF